MTPQDSPTLRVLVADDRVWSIGTRYVLNNTVFDSLDAVVGSAVEHLISDELYGTLDLDDPRLVDRVAELERRAREAPGE